MGIEIGALAGWLGTTVLLGAAGTGAAIGVSEMQKAGKKSESAYPSLAMPDLPKAPTIGTEATAAEKARIRKKTKTILTSPLTDDEPYGVQAPTLLGSGDVTKKSVLG